MEDGDDYRQPCQGPYDDSDVDVDYESPTQVRNEL